MLIKQKSPLLPRNLALGTFLPSVPNKGKSVIPSLLSGQEVLSSAYNKAKLFAENFSMNFNLDDSLSLYLISILELSCNCIIFL